MQVCVKYFRAISIIATLNFEVVGVNIYTCFVRMNLCRQLNIVLYFFLSVKVLYDFITHILLAQKDIWYCLNKGSL